MLAWSIAAAQYAPRDGSIAENIAHHLRFIDAAAHLDCKVLIFPELSLTGPNDKQELPSPLSDAQLQPLTDAARRHQMTIIAGLPVEENGQRRKGVAIFAPDALKPYTCLQGNGTCLTPESHYISVFNLNNDGCDLAPQASLLATLTSTVESQQSLNTQRLQWFARKHAIAVLKSNYSCDYFSGGSALWDETGQLIVRADQGELLVTGRKSAQGWQGDIIPLR
ncbi:carbon-nitrogen hydrolase family protein [Pseudocitrobacter cyperus]|uniref:Carbon-nitrogen hydrolase family protein n=1 Tax=Pseudocitrobacter cyperus TaxID=3112843 RepID=A0ABV0HDF9_9ENTR